MNSATARSGDDGAMLKPDRCGIAALGEREERQAGGPSLGLLEHPTNPLG